MAPRRSTMEAVLVALVIPCCECREEFDPENAIPAQEPTYEFRRCDVADGTIMCPTCLYENTVPCEICNETVRKTAARPIGDGMFSCLKHGA